MRGRLLRLLQGLPRHRAGLRARSTSTSASATRSCRAIATTASRCGAAPTAPSATASPAAPRCASTSASCGTRRTCPGALTREEFDDEPAASRSRQRGHAGGAQLRLHARRLHGADPARRGPDARVGHPAQLPGPGPPAVLRGHRRHHLRWSTELRWILAAPLFGRGNRLTAGLQYCGHPADRRATSPTSWATAARRPRTRSTRPPISGSTPRSSTTSRPASPWCSAAAASTRPAPCATASRCGTGPATATATTPTRWTSSRCRPRSASSGGRRRPCRSSATPATPTSRRCSSS